MGISRRFKLVLGIIIPFFCIFLMSHNTFATTLDYNQFFMRLRYWNGNSYEASGVMYYNNVRYNVANVDRVVAGVHVNTTNTGPTYMTGTAKFNLVAFTDAGTKASLPVNTGGSPYLYAVNVDGTSYNFESSSTTIYETDWRCDPLNSGINIWCRTFTYKVSFIARNVPSSIGDVTFGVQYSTPLSTNYNLGANYYFEGGTSNRAQIDFSTDYQASLMTQQIQLQSITNTTLNSINDSTNDYYNHEYEAENNISSQNSGDIPNSADQQTTNLIGIISGFITTISGLNTTGNCSFTLPFPEFAGGSKVVNICSGRDYMSVNGVLGYDINLVSIFGRFMLICFFVPICFILLRMIYKEIRSWTNG